MILLLGACGPVAGANQAPSDVRAWFDAPRPGTVLYPPNPFCQIVAHGASPAGIAEFELSVNGEASVITAARSGGSHVASLKRDQAGAEGTLATLTRDCGVADPGLYRLMIRAHDNAGAWSNYAETHFIIAGVATPTSSPVPGRAQPPTPTFTPAPALTGAASIEAISDDVIYSGKDSCGATQVTIVARATSPEPIRAVVLFFRYEPGSPRGFDSMSMSPLGNDLFQAVLNPTAVLGGPAEATLQYQVVVQQQDGDTNIRTPVIADIAVLPCGTGGGGGTSCSSYTDDDACEAAGCNWVLIPATVPLYACRNP
jgi:hypothetical protein